MKKKILIALAVILVLAAAIAFPFVRYMWDPKDNEELFRQNVAAVGYGNTVEAALPQTELYNTIKFHFNSPLETGKTEKKAIAKTKAVKKKAEAAETKAAEETVEPATPKKRTRKPVAEKK